jgi:predicted ATPase/Flp pilus assembly protein TadD
VRTVGPEIRGAARDALASALAALERFLPLPKGLRPVRLYYDVSSPYLEDAVLENAAGNSLGLPLTLAFLSALLDAPISPLFGATGAVGVDSAADVIGMVGNIVEKQAALAHYGVPHLLAPDGKDQVLQVAEAASRLMPGFTPRPPALVSPLPREETFTVLLAILPPVGEVWEGESRRLAESVLNAFGGALFAPRQLPPDTDAEPLCAVFPNVETAREAAQSLRQTLLCHPWLEKRIPPLRAALHRDTMTFLRDGSGCGPGMEHLALLCEAAPSGATLVSGAFKEVRSPGAPRLIPLGAQRLRSLEPAMPLYLLPFSGVKRPTDSLHVLEPQRHNLPVLLQPRVGREKEIEAVLRLLRQPGTHLVTLVGEGGLGKTRLGLEVAARAALDYPDGVWFIAMTQAKSAREVAQTVAAVMRLSGKSLISDPVRAVVEMLATSRALLILDNADTAVEGLEFFVTSLQRGAPEVQILATSRTVLQLRNETLYRVQPLSLPEADVVGEASECHTSEAEALFIARARQVNPDFHPKGAERDVLRRICRLLKGVPLSLEIAAAQSARISLAEMETRLEEALANGGEASPLLTRTLEWAYALLSAGEQRLLLRLAVFVEGFTGEAAEAVHEGEDARNDLIGLEEKALVFRRPDGDTLRRYLLPPVQEFARNRMRRDKQPVTVEEAEQAHARYFRALAMRLFYLFNMLDSQAEVDALDVLDREMANLRLTLEYTQKNDIADLPALVMWLSEHWRHRGHDHDCRVWSRAVVTAMEIGRVNPTPYIRARIFRLRAMEFMDVREYDKAEPYIATALEAAEESENDGLLADMLNLHGLYLLGRGQFDEAAEAYLRARVLFHGKNNLRGEITSLNNLGIVAVKQNKFEDAFRIYDEVVRLCQRSDNPQGALYALNNVAYVLAVQGKMDEAIERYNDAVDIAFEIKQVRILGQSLVNLGDLMEMRGEVEAAVPILIHAEQLLLRVSHHNHEDAAEYIARAAPRYGAERIAALRHEIARKTMNWLLRTDPRPGRQLGLPSPEGDNPTESP